MQVFILIMQVFDMLVQVLTPIFRDYAKKKSKPGLIPNPRDASNISIKI